MDKTAALNSMDKTAENPGVFAKRIPGSDRQTGGQIPAGEQLRDPGGGKEGAHRTALSGTEGLSFSLCSEGLDRGGRGRHAPAHRGRAVRGVPAVLAAVLFLPRRGRRGDLLDPFYGHGGRRDTGGSASEGLLRLPTCGRGSTIWTNGSASSSKAPTSITCPRSRAA